MLVQAPAPERSDEVPRVGLVFRAGVVALIAAAMLSGLGRVGDAMYVVAFGMMALALLIRKRVDAFVLVPTLYLAGLLVSAMVVDSLPNTDSLEAFTSRLPEFLLEEGRVFLALLPLLLAAVCRPLDRDLDFVMKLYRLTAWIGLVMITIGQVPPLRSLFYAQRTGHLFGLTSSHHVSGFVFGTVALVLLTTHRGSRRVNLVLGVSMLAAVVFTGSRTTTVGLLVAGLGALVFRSSSHISARWLKRFRVAFVVALALFLPLQSALNLPILEPEVISEGIENLSSPDAALGTGAYDPRTANSLKRFVLWGEALDAFAASPFVGIGAFRYNDEIDETTGMHGVVELATGGRRNHSATTAHNSYIHTMAEMGIVGLVLLLAVWLGLLVRLNRQRRLWWADDRQRSDAESAMIVVVFALGTGLTSAALFIPGLCTPVLVYVASIAMRGDLVRRPPVAVEP